MGCRAPPRAPCTHLTNPRRVRRGGGPAFRGRGGGRSHLPGAPVSSCCHARVSRVSRGCSAPGLPPAAPAGPGGSSAAPPGRSAAEREGRPPPGLVRPGRESWPEPLAPCPRPPTSRRGDSGPWRAWPGASAAAGLGRRRLLPGAARRACVWMCERRGLF